MSNNSTDYRLNIATQLLPGGKIELDWRVYGIVPPQLERDRYEVEVLEGSSYGHSGILYAGWVNTNGSDIGFCIGSWAALGIVKVGWKVYLKEAKQFPDMSYIYVS